METKSGLLMLAAMIAVMSLALTRSPFPLPLLRRSSPSLSDAAHLRPPKSRTCPLWSSRCPSSSVAFSSPPAMAAAAVQEGVEQNPLPTEFVFPPFDAVEAKHVRPGIRALLKQLVRDLMPSCSSLHSKFDSLDAFCFQMLVLGVGDLLCASSSPLHPKL